MKVRVFTLTLDPETGAFDDTAVVEFLEGRDAIALSEHLFTYGGAPTLALVIQYRDAPLTPVPRRHTDAALPPRGQPEHRALFLAQTWSTRFRRPSSVAA